MGDAAIHYNLTQVFYLFQAVGRYMIAQRSSGSLVAIASVDGIAAQTYHATYGAAKASVISLVKTFADELGRYGLRANAVAPGNVGSGNENQPPNEYAVNGINRLATPRTHDIANAALFLSSELAARITGQTLVVDGGATIRQLWGLCESMIPSDPEDALPGRQRPPERVLGGRRRARRGVDRSSRSASQPFRSSLPRLGVWKPELSG